MNNAVYKGDRQNFTLETYYSIMSKAFNDLEAAGPAHSLSEQQKITKFKQGLKDPNAISWAITAKNQWNSFAAANQTFDAYYNKFSQFMTKFKTLSSSSSRTSPLAPMSTGRGRGRGRGGRGNDSLRFALYPSKNVAILTSSLGNLSAASICIVEKPSSFFQLMNIAFGSMLLRM